MFLLDVVSRGYSRIFYLLTSLPSSSYLFLFLSLSSFFFLLLPLSNLCGFSLKNLDLGSLYKKEPNFGFSKKTILPESHESIMDIVNWGKEQWIPRMTKIWPFNINCKNLNLGCFHTTKFLCFLFLFFGVFGCHERVVSSPKPKLVCNRKILTLSKQGLLASPL